MVRVIGTVPSVFEIQDLNREAIEGTFYREEIQKVQKKKKDDMYRIEKIVKENKHKVLVKWLG